MGRRRINWGMVPGMEDYQFGELPDESWDPVRHICVKCGSSWWLDGRYQANSLCRECSRTPFQRKRRKALGIALLPLIGIGNGMFAIRKAKWKVEKKFSQDSD
jgi:hypothetical protein